MAGTLILHVGYPKTGTTTLQGALFDALDGVTYLGKRAGAVNFDADWVERFRTLINFGTDWHVEAAAEEISAAVLESAGETRILVSLEGITNPFVDTHYTQMKDVGLKAAHVAALLAPARAAGLKVRFLATLRDQVALVPSLFAQIYVQGLASGLFGKSYDDFLAFLFEDDVLGAGPMFFFDQLLDRYGDLFGAEAMVALPMGDLFKGEETPGVVRLAEMLGRTPGEVVEKLTGAALNVRRAKGSSTYRMMTVSPAAERLAGLSGYAMHRAGFGPADRARLALGRDVSWTLPDRSAAIRAYYAASNARLAGRYGVQL